jgi:hypothetical protein
MSFVCLFIDQFFLPALSSKIGSFNPAAVIKPQSPAHSVAAIKAFIESNGLADASVYPSFLPVFPSVLLPWLQKAIAAREAAIAFHLEVKKTALESQQ